MCLPQPFQVVFPHTSQVVGRHMLFSFRCCAPNPSADPRHGALSSPQRAGCTVTLGQPEEQFFELGERHAAGFDKRFYRFGRQRIIVFMVGVLDRALGHDRGDR